MSTTPQRFEPRTPHKGRPNGLQPVINRLPDTIGIIFDALLRSLIVKSGLYLLRLPASAGKRDRSGVFLANLCSVLSVLLDNCQTGNDVDGLIAVPHGSRRGTETFMPLTKCRRADTMPTKEEKDYMHGIAALAGVCVATAYCMIAVLRYLGIVQHGGYFVTENRRAHPIRISKLWIQLPVREWLYRITGAADVWRERHVKKSEKAAKRNERKYFVAEKASAAGSAMPKRLADQIRSTRTWARETIHHAKNRTLEFVDLLRAGLTPEEAVAKIKAMPQGP